MTEESSGLEQAGLPCPDCGSSDALAKYRNGTYCFSCGAATTGDVPDVTPKGSSRAWIQAEPKALKKRGISQETCRIWGYGIGEDEQGRSIQVASFRDRKGKLVRQKLRYPDKKFQVIGDGKCLYGAHLWRDAGRRIVVTEGEIDALSVSQAQGNKWPVVSLPDGAQSARKALAAELEWLEGFEEVVLMFDADEPGQKAAEQCATLFAPGKCKLARLPEGFKDANELLVAGRERDIIDALWSAKAYRPDGVVTAADVAESALQPEERGMSWPWEELSNLTYGIRRRECYAIGAGTGVGKTDFITECVAHLIEEHQVPVGCVFLEQNPGETLRRVAGKMASKAFHVPDAEWTREELVAAVSALADSNKLYLYDHFGAADWDTVKSRIRFMVQALDVKDIFLDHITALTAQAEDERREAESIMADIGSMVQELDCTIYFVSHLSTPDGKPHEEGGRVMIRHFKGSRSIGFWSSFMFGLERDQQSTDERDVTTFRVLKDRKTGRATGQTFHLKYHHDTGRMLKYSPEFDATEEEKHDDW